MAKLCDGLALHQYYRRTYSSIAPVDCGVQKLESLGKQCRVQAGGQCAVCRLLLPYTKSERRGYLRGGGGWFAECGRARRCKHGAAAAACCYQRAAADTVALQSNAIACCRRRARRATLCRTLWGMPREVEKSMHQFQFIDICIWLSAVVARSFYPFRFCSTGWYIGWCVGWQARQAGKAGFAAVCIYYTFLPPPASSALTTLRDRK